ncbi:MAG: hypothetical protein HY276_01570 [Ignavibacteriales bacterium]|nr:hypothetical protein [Ignavibacteriales bacterium]
MKHAHAKAVEREGTVSNLHLVKTQGTGTPTLAPHSIRPAGTGLKTLSRWKYGTS